MLTEQELETAIKADPYFEGKDEQTIQFTITTGKYLIKALGEQLDQPITVTSLWEAKLAINSIAVSLLFPEKAHQVIEDDNPIRKVTIPNLELKGISQMFADMAEAMMFTVLENAIEQMSEIAKNAPKLLEEQGLTEEQFFMHPQLNLAPELKDAYKQHTLTASMILLRQPSIIVTNM